MIEDEIRAIVRDELAKLLSNHPDKSSDSQVIAALGGPAKVAELLGFPKSGGVQRVQNWTVRGIPAAVKVSRPELFLNEYVKNLPPGEQGA